MRFLEDVSLSGVDRTLEELDRVRRLESDLAGALRALREILRSLPRDERVEVMASLTPVDRDRLG